MKDYWHRFEQYMGSTKKCGYKDSMGKIRIPAIYDDAPYSIDGDLIPVAKGRKYGIINRDRECIINFEYDEVLILNEETFAVCKDSSDDWSFTVINRASKQIIPNEYKHITREGIYIKCSNCCIRKNDWRTLSSNGSKNTYIDKDDSYDWYDFSGKLVFSGESICAYGEYIINRNEGKCGVVGCDGEQIIPCSYDKIEDACNGRFVVKNIVNEGTTQYAVLSKEKILIDFQNSEIKSHEGHYFSSRGDNENWYDLNGNKVHDGGAEYLGKGLLAICKNNKWGVIDDHGKRILPFNYTGLERIGDVLLTKKDGKIGFCSLSGQLLIDTIYMSIECVNVDDRQYHIQGRNYYERKEMFSTWGFYTSEHYFDTDSNEHENSYIRILVGEIGNKVKRSYPCKILETKENFNLTHPLILRTEQYAELFSLEDGVFADSRYDSIDVLSNKTCIVSKDGLYGVYCLAVKKLIIPCEYSRVKYEGRNYVLYEKDSKWGARYIPGDRMDGDIFDKIMSVIINIKCEYTDLQYLRTNLFSCSRDADKSSYYIVNGKGQETIASRRLGCFDEPLRAYSKDAIVGKKGKYGLIDLNGFTKVPYKYDSIEIRKDGNLNISINGGFGIMDVKGREIISPKYRTILPDDLQKTYEVTDAFSEARGVVQNGKEIIPSIYGEVHRWENLFVVGVDRFETDEYYYNEETGGVEYVHPETFCRLIESWDFTKSTHCRYYGILDKDGNELIPTKYDCIKFQKGYILAGRDGNFLFHDSDYDSSERICSEYSGVYDLYDTTGKLIFGGFNKFDYVEDQQIFLFHFGGHWRTYSECVDEWNNICIDTFEFVEGTGRWLFTDKDLTSIVPDKSGKPHKFESGFIGTIRKEEKDGKTTEYWNLPLECFVFNHWDEDSPAYLIKDDIFEWRKEEGCVPIRISDKAVSPNTFYDIMHIAEDRFFTKVMTEDHKFYIGMADVDRILIPAEYCLITKPVYDSVFAIKHIGDGKYTVLFIDLRQDDIIPVVAIKEIEIDSLYKPVLQGYLTIVSFDRQCLKVKDSSLFDSGFCERLNVVAIENAKVESDYFYSVDGHFSFDYLGGGEWREEKSYYDCEDERYDALNDAFEGEVDLYNDWLLN